MKVCSSTTVIKFPPKNYDHLLNPFHSVSPSIWTVTQKGLSSIYTLYCRHLLMSKNVPKPSVRPNKTDKYDLFSSSGARWQVLLIIVRHLTPERLNA